MRAGRPRSQEGAGSPETLDQRFPKESLQRVARRIVQGFAGGCMAAVLTAACCLGARASRPHAGLKARVPNGSGPSRPLSGHWGRPVAPAGARALMFFINADRRARSRLQREGLGGPTASGP